MQRFVIKHKDKGYFMNGSTHLENIDRFSKDLQSAKVFSTHSSALSSITYNFTKPYILAAPAFTTELEIIEVYLTLGK